MTTNPGWPQADVIETERLILEPLRADHAVQMAPVLDDERLHTFIGGEPATVDQLRSRYAVQSLGHSPDGSEGWLNWVLRSRSTGSPVGTVQATLTRDGDRTVGEVAWVVAVDEQGNGYAVEAATAMAGWLRRHGADPLIAHVNPDHGASIGVAKRLGMRPTTEMVDGETRWTTGDPATPAPATADPAPPDAAPPDPAPALVIAGYDPYWQERGAELVEELRAALGPLAVRLEHIGSTAIPGMAAKPVFDLQVSVHDLAQAAEAFDAPLAAFDLVRRPWEQDHVPAGVDDDPARWAKRLWGRGAPGGERINLHCRLVGSPNERLALLFRDWFRAHPMAVAAYARFKEVLADAVGDLEVYTDVKDPVVDLVIVVAEQWAEATGWRPL